MPAPELSSDLTACGLDPNGLAWLFPFVPTCEFVNVPMHGCECNGCVEWRAAELVAVPA